MGFANTVTSPLTLLPLAGAWLASVAGMDALFTVILFAGMAYLLLALLLDGGHRPAESD